MADAADYVVVESALPEVIRTYQAAHDAHDNAAALATFAADATVVDDGNEYAGHDAIGGWLARTASEFTYTRAFLEASSLGSGGWLVVNRLEGNFPGNVVDLRYEFHVTDGLIVRLVIAP